MRKAKETGQSLPLRQLPRLWKRLEPIWRALPALGAGLPAFLPVSALALPQGAEIVEGEARIEEEGSRLDIYQHSEHLIIDWSSFVIEDSELVHVHAPQTHFSSLHRNLSDDALRINGALICEASCVLSSPAGIVIGNTARIDVNRLVATTLTVNPVAFLEGRLELTQDQERAPAMILNAGTLTVQETGYAALVAPAVRNDGVIAARLGRVELVAGTAATLDLYGDGLLTLRLPVEERPIDPDSGQPVAHLIENTGRLQADGGTVLIHAAQAERLVESVINTTGVVRANRVYNRGGTVVFAADGPGVVEIGGTVSATGTASGEEGGRIAVSGEHIEVKPGSILDVSGRDQGGRITLGAARALLPEEAPAGEAPLPPAAKPAPPPSRSAGPRAHVPPPPPLPPGPKPVAPARAESVHVADTATLRADTTQPVAAALRPEDAAPGVQALADAANGGTIALEARQAITVGGSLSAQGGQIRALSEDALTFDGAAATALSISLAALPDPTSDSQAPGLGAGTTLLLDTHLDAAGQADPGGAIDVFGRQVLLLGETRLDASGGGGGGRIRIGGDYRGEGATPRATRTLIGADVTLTADATALGEGGRVIVWSDHLTRFEGTLSARGGSLGGDGGFAEVSSKGRLAYRGLADLRAPEGTAGQLLLDPTDITLCSACGTSASLTFDDLYPDGFADDGSDMASSTLLVDDLLAQLDLADVTISTDSGGSGSGSITVDSAIDYSGAADRSLTLEADGSILVNQGITASGSGTLALTLDARNDPASTISVNADIDSGGADVSLMANDGITVADGVSLAAANGATLSLDADYDADGSGTLTLNGTLGTAGDDSSSIELYGADLDFGANGLVVSDAIDVIFSFGTGTLTLGDGLAAGDVHLSAADLGHFQRVTDWGYVALDATATADPVTLGTLSLDDYDFQVYGGGDVVVDGPLDYSGSDIRLLTLDAGAALTIEGPLTASGGSGSGLEISATAWDALTVNGAIDSGDGNVTLWGDSVAVNADVSVGEASLTAIATTDISLDSGHSVIVEEGLLTLSADGQLGVDGTLRNNSTLGGTIELTGTDIDIGSSGAIEGDGIWIYPYDDTGALTLGDGIAPGVLHLSAAEMGRLQGLTAAAEVNINGDYTSADTTVGTLDLNSGLVLWSDDADIRIEGDITAGFNSDPGPDRTGVYIGSIGTGRAYIDGDITTRSGTVQVERAVIGSAVAIDTTDGGSNPAGAHVHWLGADGSSTGSLTIEAGVLGDVSFQEQAGADPDFAASDITVTGANNVYVTGNLTAGGLDITAENAVFVQDEFQPGAIEVASLTVDAPLVQLNGEVGGQSGADVAIASGWPNDNNHLFDGFRSDGTYVDIADRPDPLDTYYETASNALSLYQILDHLDIILDRTLLQDSLQGDQAALGQLRLLLDQNRKNVDGEVVEGLQTDIDLITEGPIDTGPGVLPSAFRDTLPEIVTMPGDLLAGGLDAALLQGTQALTEGLALDARAIAAMSETVPDQEMGTLVRDLLEVLGDEIQTLPRRPAPYAGPTTLIPGLLRWQPAADASRQTFEAQQPGTPVITPFGVLR